MTKQYKLLFDTVENYKDTILEAERYIWEHPEVGYREWNTHAFMKEHFVSLGYEVHEAGDIPGFYADIDTGREGPKLGIFAEMDALLIRSPAVRQRDRRGSRLCPSLSMCSDAGSGKGS